MTREALPMDYRHTEPPLEWTLLDLLAVFGRRRAWIFGALAICCAAALLYWILSTPRYRATAVIEVHKDSRGAFGLDNTTADRPSADVTDTFDDNLTLQTEVGILESDALTLEVIRRLQLEPTPDYFAPARTTPGTLRRVLDWHAPLEPLSVPLAESPDRRFAALRIFAAHRKIAPQLGTRLIAVSYSDPSPERAAAVVSALVQALSDYGFQSRSAAAAQSASWLSAQLAGLKQQTDTLDARAAALDRTSGDYGDDSAHNPVLARLDTLNAALATAESSRIVREAIWRAVQNGDAEKISGLAGSPDAGPNTQNSLALLQSFRAQETSLQAQIAESSRRYGQNWPAFAEQRAHLESVRNSIGEENHLLAERARTDYEVAVQAENSARDTFTHQKDLASHLTGDAVALRLARQEAGESRSLYTSLLGRLQQTGILEGLHSANFTVVSPALIPAPSHPSSPNLPLLGALAFGLGTTLGCGAAIARELTDNTLHSAAEMELLLDAPVFATVPGFDDDAPWYRRMLPLPFASALLRDGSRSALETPISETPFVESLHRLRASLLLSHSDQPPRIITITDSRRASNASQPCVSDHAPSLALSLATVLAQQGSAVLFVDADLRAAPEVSPSIDPGLSEMLSNQALPPATQRIAELPSLSVLQAGRRPPCPAELIASPRMTALLAAWREEFDFIVIRGPAALHADALVLAQLSDAVLLTAEAGKTQRNEILPAFQSLSRQVPGHAVLGLVLHQITSGSVYARA
jgi:succinoglycan biosynthesis transport protein ExoP